MFKHNLIFFCLIIFFLQSGAMEKERNHFLNRKAAAMILQKHIRHYNLEKMKIPNYIHMHNKGRLYIEGLKRGFEENSIPAIAYAAALFLPLANAGCPHAQYNMGSIYAMRMSYGLVSQRHENYEAALRWLLEAEHGGSEQAGILLERLVSDPAFTNLLDEAPVAEDLERFFQEALDDFTLSRSRVAVTSCDLSGFLDKFKVELKKLADEGCIKACFYLSIFLINDNKISAAKYYFRKITCLTPEPDPKPEYIKAHYYLGLILRCERYNIDAVYHLKKAASYGYMKARKILKDY